MGDAVSDQRMSSLSFEERATELAAAIKVLANPAITDAHWPMACADVLCALARADNSAVAHHSADGVRVDGRAAHRLLGVRATSYFGGDALPAAGIWLRSDGRSAKASLRVTVYTEPGHTLSLMLFFDRATTTEETDRARLLLEIAEPVLASSATFRAQLARRTTKVGTRAAVLPGLAGDDAARLRDRYGLTLREIADRLNISEHTARHHTESVLGKLGIRSRAAIPRAVSPLRSSGPFRAS